VGGDDTQEASRPTRRRLGRLALLTGATVTALGVAGVLLTAGSGGDRSGPPAAASVTSSPQQASPRVEPPKVLDGPPPGSGSGTADTPSADAEAPRIPVVPPRRTLVTYPDGTKVTWPAPASGRAWVDPRAGGTKATAGGRDFAAELLRLVPGSRTPPQDGLYEEGSGGRVGAYSATVIDGDATYGSAGVVRRGRFVMARVSRGGTSLIGSDFDRCGWWPTDGASLGMEGLTPTAPVQKVPGSTDTLRCSVTEVEGVTVVHAERSGPADPDHPGSVAGTQREAFTVLSDGTAVNVSSSALATEGKPGSPRDWDFLDDLLLKVHHPART
jgi:hypothetical protein